MNEIHAIGDFETTLESGWKRARIVAVAGDVTIDATASEWTPAKRHLDILCAAGDVELRIKRGTGVDVWGPPIGRDIVLERADDGAPRIRVRWLRVFGDLAIVQQD